ncbi:hypothetical protein HY68_14230 [Streptomyces sp. AcH 505]|uniref:DUF3344 domain-containing protein n=1 Tax=Streptomyces sp. AcH 505 TaxID=352211 RepID=UPI0005921ED5|nr:hypothetical protein HY68_14230 [Streptomyces sp. AcH 505]
MRNSAVHAVRRGVLCALTVYLLSAAAPPAPTATPAATPPATPAPAAGPREASRIPFAERYSTVQHGGIVRAANSAISCRSADGAACTSARTGSGTGARAANHDFDMFYTDVDKDPNTYNSTRAELRVPKGATVSYARLYWGGNLRVGEQKPPKDNGRVLVAEPGGAYKQVLADSLIGHRVVGGADAYQASADVTPLVRASGPGMYTVAQLNVAMGKSGVGAWGGWTLVVAYEKDDAPLRRIALWDGFESFDAEHHSGHVDFGEMRVPAGGSGLLGVVAYDGDNGITGDSLKVVTNAAGPNSASRRDKGVSLTNKSNKSGDVMNSSITDAGSSQIKRQPAYANNLGYDSDVFDLKAAFSRGGDRFGVRFGTGRDSVWLGAFFVEAEARH